MTDPIEAVKQFFAAMDTTSLDDAAKALESLVTDDFVWENSGLPTVNGPQGGADFLRYFGTVLPMVGIKVDWIAVAAAGNVVVTERVDHMVDAEGNKLLSLPLAGTLEVAEDGKIKAWRDYFDPRPFFPTA